MIKKIVYQIEDEYNSTTSTIDEIRQAHRDYWDFSETFKSEDYTEELDEDGSPILCYMGTQIGIGVEVIEVEE